MLTYILPNDADDQLLDTDTNCDYFDADDQLLDPDTNCKYLQILAPSMTWDMIFQ